ncbi:MAG: NADH-quinone oxidoreductase subunit C, partial [Limisphaerales bacterium]
VAWRNAMVYGLLGPIARASGLVRDLRRAQSYSGYESFQFDVPGEKEGDGYARLRILFAEARQSVRIMEQAVAALQGGGIREPVKFQAGAALGWVEAPRGGAFHWVRLNEGGKILRYRIVPPSFANWHGFHLAVEKFAFQDFSIMLSTFDLSVAENDR